jgi:hypothetical protein
MSKTSLKTALQSRPRRRLPEIKLPNGRTLILRADFAHDVIGESERTTKRKGYPSVKVGGVVYIEKEGALEMLAASVHRPDEPKPRRRGRRT